mgnify:CR=1 FL=1
MEKQLSRKEKAEGKEKARYRKGFKENCQTHKKHKAETEYKKTGKAGRYKESFSQKAERNCDFLC